MAKGIIEKQSGGLFENEIEMQGKYATMARFLRDEIGLFSTFREVYVTGAIVGYLNGLSEMDDKDDKVQSASIFPNELSNRKKDLRFIYRTIMLLKDEPNYTIDDYKNRAFRDDSEENADLIRENMQIFNSYACGGVEYLYRLFQDCDSPEKTVDALYEYIHKFCIDTGVLEGGDELPDFNPIFD